MSAVAVDQEVQSMQASILQIADIVMISVPLALLSIRHLSEFRDLLIAYSSGIAVLLHWVSYALLTLSQVVDAAANPEEIADLQRVLRFAEQEIEEGRSYEHVQVKYSLQYSSLASFLHIRATQKDLYLP